MFDMYLINCSICLSYVKKHELVFLSLRSYINTWPNTSWAIFYLNNKRNNILIMTKLVIQNLYWCALIFCYNRNLCLDLRITLTFTNDINNWIIYVHLGVYFYYFYNDICE